MMVLSRAVSTWLVVVAAASGCSLVETFDGLTGGPDHKSAPEDDPYSAGDGSAAAALTDAAAISNDAGPRADASVTDAGGARSFCTTMTDASLCEDFDDGKPLGQSAAGWTGVAGPAELSLVGEAFSAPRAMAMAIPVVAGAERQPDSALEYAFKSTVGAVRCQMMIARDDLAGAQLAILSWILFDAPGYSHFDVRLMARGNTQLEVGVRGISSTLDEYVSSPITLTEAAFVPVAFSARFRGTLAATIEVGTAPAAIALYGTKIPLSAPPTGGTLSVGHTYSIATANANPTKPLRARYDDVACWLTP